MNSIVNRASDRAAQLLAASSEVQTPAEKSEAARMARLMDDPRGKSFTLAMADRVFRSREPRLQAGRLRAILQQYGVPHFLSGVDKLLLRSGALASHLAPSLVMSSVEEQLRRDSARVILPGESEPLKRYLAARRDAGTRVNLNHLGEAILGEDEAGRRLAAVLQHLANPDVNYVSVKISAIFSQINLLDWEGTLATLKERLRTLYRAAMPAGKFVNLDMEEYRDLELTLAAFQQVLGETEFRGLSAGMVLQAYLPDSWPAQQQLAAWARERVASGGAPVKLRLVKGANLAMESVEAELRGWNPAPYATKAETDANYRRMLEFGCKPENARALRLGVASHNLFDVALALVLREECGVREFVELEMLEGMANHQARAVQAKAGGLLVYAPVVLRKDFTSAMAYLVRRLDENTAPENFLHDLFGLAAGSLAWERQRQRFVAGWESRNAVSDKSRRAELPSVPNDGRFHNVPDTDWTQLKNRQRLAESVSKWSAPQPPAAGDLNTVLAAAQAAQIQWASRSIEQRAAILRACAEVIETQRFETIVEMMHEGKKAAWEGDTEVSEAADFARYYAVTFAPPPDVRATPLGIVAVTPPWNFPYAIPCSGVLAALMAGNSVVLKPAPETVAIAWRLAQQLWEGGVPRDVLQFFPCADGEIGRALITDPRIAAVVLTGAYETARMFLSWRPSLKLFAETSGKNAIVITAQADRDLAIKDLVKSAFGHAGQKCSAASLAILEAEVYDDPDFRRQLRDAAASLRVGPATDFASVVTPLIREPGAALKRGLTTLDDGEEWLLEPRVSENDPCLWSPGIKLGVRDGSWFHRTECFGPVLGVMRARNLDEAIRFQNDTAFGLTGGIHSLDEKEIAHWRERVQVGNAYINRAITGAIVQRQPFGGWKRSCIGPGAKAGGPNYVAMFSRLEDTECKEFKMREKIQVVDTPFDDYSRTWRTDFSLEHDPSGLRCEANVFRYRPCGGVILRTEIDDKVTLETARLLATFCGVQLFHASIGSEETEAQLIARLPGLALGMEVLRTITPPSDALLTAAYEAGLNWIDGPLLANGRYELTRWHREQSVSETRHRYGQLENAAVGSTALK